jgi:hypothetical protein
LEKQPYQDALGSNRKKLRDRAGLNGVGGGSGSKGEKASLALLPLVATSILNDEWTNNARYGSFLGKLISKRRVNQTDNGQDVLSHVPDISVRILLVTKTRKT